MTAPKQHEFSLETSLALGRLPTETADDRAVLSRLWTSWYEENEEVKWPRMLQYFENAAYLIGNHLTRFYYTGQFGFGFQTFGTTDRSAYDGLVAKSADNKLLRPTGTFVSMLTQNLPQPRIEPNSDSVEDEDAAELAEIVLQLHWEKPLNMPNLLQRAALTAAVMGMPTVEVGVGETDIPTLVPDVQPREVPNELFDPDQEESEENPRKVKMPVQVGYKAVPRKDLQAKLWTPYHMNFNPDATCAEELQWVARTSFIDIDQLRERFDKDEEGYFPDALDDIKDGPNSSRYGLYWYARFQDIIESPQYYQHGGGLTAGHGGAASSGYAPNQTLMTVVDVKPTLDFPQGRTLIFAGGHLIYAGKARAWSEQYPDRWHPYAFFSWFELPGRFLGIPLLSELVPLQKKINSIDNLVHANRQFMAVGQWMVPFHAQVAGGKISGIPGEHIEYKSVPGMSDPARVPHVPLPGELLAERDQLEKSIDYIAASGLVADKVSASAARAGIILDKLQSEKMESQAPMLLRWQYFLERIGQNILIEFQTNMPDESMPELAQRIRQAAPHFSEQMLAEFTGSSLRDHHRIEIDISSELRHSPEALAEKAGQYAQFAAGLVQLSPAEREAVQTAMGLDRFIKTQEMASIKRARRMLARIKAGQLESFLPMPGIDNPAVMTPIFQNYLLSDRFHEHEAEIKQAIIAAFQHYAQETAKQQQQAMQQQLAMAKAMKAAESGGGEPTPQS